jgi:iron complex transport system ATP-binding protein
VVLHDLDQAAAVADRVVLLEAGVVVADGTPAEVFTSDGLSAVYGIRIDVDHDPSTGRLRTRAVGRHHTRTERLLSSS